MLQRDIAFPCALLRIRTSCEEAPVKLFCWKLFHLPSEVLAPTFWSQIWSLRIALAWPGHFIYHIPQESVFWRGRHFTFIPKSGLTCQQFMAIGQPYIGPIASYPMCPSKWIRELFAILYHDSYWLCGNGLQNIGISSVTIEELPFQLTAKLEKSPVVLTRSVKSIKWFVTCSEQIPENN